MAQIDNPVALAFINERIRQRCEQIRALKVQMEDDVAHWFGGVNALIPNSADATVSDRLATGVQEATGAEANTVMARAISLLDILQAANAMDAVSKFCVRPLAIA